MSVVSVKSLANRLSAEWHYLLARCGAAGVSPLPAFISVEPADFCQLRCPECPVGRGSRQETKGERLMSPDTFERIVQQAQGVQVMQLYFQGEPLLNPHLPDMIRSAHEAHFYTVTSTNAQALTPDLAEHLIGAGLNRIIVSMDGISESSYQAYRRGGSLQQTMSALRYLSEAKQRLGGHTHIELQCLRLKSNEQEWTEMQRLYKTWGADSLTFKTAQLYDFAHGHPLMPTNPRYSRYRLGKDGLYHITPRHRVCHRIFTGCVITVTGDVLPCCFDKSKQFVLGNVHQQSLRDIWQGDKARAFRQQVIAHRPSMAMCSNCTE